MIKELLKNTIWQWYQFIISRVGIHYTHLNKVALCCMGKCENLYIREWVEYYHDLGFPQIRN